MSTGTLAEEVQPYELGARSASLQGRIPLACFTRLSTLIERGEDSVQADLRFSLDEQGRCYVDGDLRVGLELHCLGCVQNVAHELRVGIHLVLVRSDEEATALMRSADSIVQDNQPTTLAKLLEDDLILALPEIVCGDLANCPNRPVLEYSEAVASTSPFSALGSLIRKGSLKKRVD